MNVYALTIRKNNNLTSATSTRDINEARTLFRNAINAAKGQKEVLVAAACVATDMTDEHCATARVDWCHTWYSEVGTIVSERLDERQLENRDLAVSAAFRKYLEGTIAKRELVDEATMYG